MEKRINQGYEITQSIQVGRKEFVLGVHPTAPSQFVTWQYTKEHAYDWGHYYSNSLAAIKDLCERAINEIEYLEQIEAERNSIKKEQGETRKRTVQKDRNEER